MRTKATGVLFMSLVPLACGNPDDLAVQQSPQALQAGEVFKIGVLVDQAAPGRADFVAALNLAIGDLNKGLHDAGASQQFQALITTYSSTPYDPANTQL